MRQRGIRRESSLTRRVTKNYGEFMTRKNLAYLLNTPFHSTQMPTTAEETRPIATRSPIVLNRFDQSGHTLEQAGRSRPAKLGAACESLLQSWNRLSLDAPMIAVTWQWFVIANVVHDGGLGIEWAQSIVLFITVWLIYAGDRLLDVRQLDFRCEVAQRHRFTKRWAHALWPMWWVLLCVGVLIATEYLDREIWIAGMVLSLAVVSYACLVHGSQRRAVPKEFVVGFLFAVGVCLPLFCHALDVSAVIIVSLLSALFALNCLCVAAAERAIDREQQVDSAIQMFPALLSWMSRTGLALSGLAIALATSGVIPYRIGAAVAISALGLSQIGRSLVINGKHPRAASLAGYMADVALLSPIVFMIAQWACALLR